MKRAGVLLLALLLTVSGALAEEDLFTPGEAHRSQLDFRKYFRTMTAQTGACTISIAEAAYDPVQAAQVYARIAADVATLEQAIPLTPHTVYIVDELFVGMQRIESAIYCTVQDVLDGSYRTWLAEAALDVEKWRGVGLAGFVFGTETDAEALAAWYATDAHDDMLSLFHACFVPEFADAQTLRMAEQTAISLMYYIIAQHGPEAALTAEPAGYVQGWLASMGVDRAYSDPYDGMLAGYTYSRNQFYAMIATSPRGDVFKMNPLEMDMTTPAQARQALCELEKGVEAILEGVKRDAPDFFPVLLKNYAAPITYEFNDADYSITYHANRRIAVGGAVSLIHETAHMMAPCVVDRISRYMDQWKAEALAEYLTLTYYPGLMEQESLLHELQTEPSEAEAKVFWQKMREVYQRYAALPERPAEVNVKLGWRAAVVAKEELGMQRNSVSDVYAGAGSASLDEVNGNELSYTESEWLASWLIGRYGLSAFLHYCMEESVTFEAAFGMPYPAAKAAWLAERSLLD